MNTEPTDAGQQQQPDVPGSRVPVIAVFGGATDRDTLAAAEQVGREIGLSGAILLTGGDDPTATDLKGRVLSGAVKARNGGATAPWIGVVRTQMALDPKSAIDGLSLILTPGGDHLPSLWIDSCSNEALPASQSLPRKTVSPPPEILDAHFASAQRS